MVDFMVLFFTLFTLTVFPVLSAYSRQDAQRYR
jgi:hypothetical protein